MVENKAEASNIFKSKLKDLKNVIVLLRGIGGRVAVYSSGIFEGKTMIKIAETSKSGPPNLPSLRDMFRYRLADMKGYNYNIGALPYAPFLMKNKEGKFFGYEIKQVDALATLLNFSYNIIEPPDGEWGRITTHGVWTGLIGHALYGHTNWSMGLIAVTQERESVIDFCVPFYFDFLGFVAPLPKEFPKYEAIFRPFSTHCWVLLLTCLVLSGPVYSAVLKISDKLETKVGDSFLYCLSLLLKNTTKDKLNLPQLISSQLLLVSWLVFCIIISAAYSGNLISFMTYPGTENPLNTAQDIIESEYDIEIYDYGGATRAAFEATENIIFQEIWKRKSFVKSVGPSVEKVIEGKTVFIDLLASLIPSIKAGYASSTGVDTVHIGRNTFFSFMQSWAYQSGGIFKEVFDEKILLFLAVGLTQKWEEDAIYELKQSNQGKTTIITSGSENLRLNLENMHVRNIHLYCKILFSFPGSLSSFLARSCCLVYHLLCGVAWFLYTGVVTSLRTGSDRFTNYQQ